MECMSGAEFKEACGKLRLTNVDEIAEYLGLSRRTLLRVYTMPRVEKMYCLALRAVQITRAAETSDLTIAGVYDQELRKLAELQKQDWG